MPKESTLVTVAKSSENLEVGDCMLMGGVMTNILKVSTNGRDDLVIIATIAKAPSKRRSEMMLIMPKKIPVYILKWI